MEKQNKIKKHIEEAKRVLDLFYQWYEKDLNNEIYENIITALDEIIDETLSAVESERTTRVIDNDGGAASMEKRKREGYF